MFSSTSCEHCNFCATCKREKVILDGFAKSRHVIDHRGRQKKPIQQAKSNDTWNNVMRQNKLFTEDVHQQNNGGKSGDEKKYCYHKKKVECSI